MFQNAEEVISWINNRIKLGMKPGLKRMEFMMGKLGHPERHLRAVHIGGTNGKGSTVSFLRSILMEAGYEVGTFTSPYFEKFHERISINGEPISDEDLVRTANEIKPVVDELERTDLGAPTEFEIITAMGLYYFGKIHPVDCSIIEVGLGGRLDSTNVIHPLLSIITNIGHDHMHILGGTLTEIAYEKAGIIKNGVPLITGEVKQEPIQVFEKVAKERKTSLYKLGKDFSYIDLGSEDQLEVFDLETVFGSYQSLKISLKGEHQLANASLAVMAAKLLHLFYSFIIEPEHIEKGLKKAYWPGRFEILQEEPPVIIDGAHNREGIETLVETMERHYPDRKGTILFAALKDKETDKMIRELEKLGLEIVLTEFDFYRARKANELLQPNDSHKENIRIESDWKSFLKETLAKLEKDDILVITGSLYFISEVKPFILNLLKN
mgnify:FL=1